MSEMKPLVSCRVYDNPLLVTFQESATWETAFTWFQETTQSTAVQLSTLKRSSDGQGTRRKGLFFRTQNTKRINEIRVWNPVAQANR